MCMGGGGGEGEGIDTSSIPVLPVPSAGWHTGVPGGGPPKRQTRFPGSSRPCPLLHGPAAEWRTQGASGGTPWLARSPPLECRCCLGCSMIGLQRHCPSSPGQQPRHFWGEGEGVQR